MSLILATNSIDENTMEQPDARASSFTNFFRSPIEIEPNSEIAVSSIKIQRNGNIDVGEKDFFTHYWGLDPAAILEADEYGELTSISRTIKPKRGSYPLDAYAKLIQNTLNEQYADPNIFEAAAVTVNTVTDGAEDGLDIQFTDEGSASVLPFNGNNVIESMGADSVFNIRNPSGWFENDIIAPSNQFTLALSGSGSATLARIGAGAVSIYNSSCVAILTGHPFGLNEGRFDWSTTACMLAPWAVGLSRPQIQIESPESASLPASQRTIHSSDPDTDSRENGVGAVHSYDGKGSVMGPHEIYDYGVMLDDDFNVRIFSRVFFEGSGIAEERVSGHQELEYWANGGSASDRTTAMTRAQFNASYDGVRFEGHGDEIRVFFKQLGKTGYDPIVSSAFPTTGNGAGRSFSPTGSTSAALYPMLNIGDGSVMMSWFGSTYVAADESYLFPQFVAGPLPGGGYTPGSDMVSNECFFGLSEEPWVKLLTDRVLASDSQQDAIFKCDSSVPKWDFDALPTNEPYTYAGLNAALASGFIHVLTMNKINPGNTFNTLVRSQEFPTMSGRLGFRDRALAISNSTDGYVSGDDSRVVKFTSPHSLIKSALASYVRIPNLTHKSFNGAQGGLSKILYQLPEFDNGGNQYGSLYFEANEKTYVKLNNPAPLILNTLQCQIVDSFERELTTLTGATQIMFHVRPSSK
mgnify:FL=1